MSPTGRERTGYATQKPLGILERIVRVHSDPGDLLLDFFAGSGSFGEAAARNDRSFVLVDDNPEAIRIMADRLARFGPELVRLPESREPPGASGHAGSRDPSARDPARPGSGQVAKTL